MHIALPSSVAAGSATANIDFTRTYHNAGYQISKERGGGGGAGGGYTENWSSLIGIITAIVGNVLISFALNMQRYAHIRLDREWQGKERLRKKRSASSTSLTQLISATNGKDGKPTRRSEDALESDPLLPRPPVERSNTNDTTASGQEEAYKQQSYLKSPYWWLGIILMTIGEAGNFLAYGFAPASIVSPLGVVALISNCIIAPFMLKEPFRKRDALGVVIAVGGAVTVVLSANDSNPKLGPGEIWHLITRWEFETYLGITVGVICGLMVASNRFGDRSVLIDLGLVGLLGGYTALSTKGVSSLLSYTLWRAITFPVFYLLVAILIGTAIMQIKYINRALQRFDATQVIPVQFVLFTLSVIGGSAVLYRDFERTSGEDAGKFIGGCALTFFGVWLITSGRHHQDDNDEDDDREPEPEDAINLVGDRHIDEVTNMSENGASNTRRSSTTHGLSPSPTNNTLPFYTSTESSRPTTPGITIIPDPTTPPPPHPRPTTAEDVLSSLTANPWTAPNNPTSRTPPLARHTSTPVLPSEAAPPPPTPPSAPDIPLPSTPTRGKSQSEIPTTPGSQLRRLRTNERIGARNSVVGSGALLASPLSTTLSAMVQDLKRGGGSVSGSVRRRGSVLGLGGGEEGYTDGEMLGRRRTGDSVDVWGGDGGERGERGDRPTGRGRSLSGTLNGLWRGLRGRASREDVGGEGQGR
ncbi:DUF803-domain-containing protein [Plenodomus tracheiphilus IPT5]|uniref:DUF803-domain-containing protein n=1 Tax=Plenodomus tracheiphilus IPT5 TaxID=1408161 RepID=A0A6A7AW14_9PLEO|nr:DUF803-domain-containing protein [Plenodomus tracheiphilus IPT5]